MKGTLLELDKVPTLEELKAFFKANDFSSAQYYEKEALSNEQSQAISEMGNMFKEQWDTLSKDKGLKSAPVYYENDNPLMKMRENMADLMGGGVYKLLDEHPEKASEILDSFSDQLHDKEKADKIFRNSIDTLMNVMDYENLADIIQTVPAHEDFSNKQNNHRKQDFDRKWGHTRTKVSVQSLEEMNENVPAGGYSAEDQAIHNIIMDNFWRNLSGEDKLLLRYSIDGMTQKEIAEKLGYKTHSAVTKRLAKLKKSFYL